jgi:hypothetical protein
MTRVKKAELDALLELLNSEPLLPQRRYPEIGYYYLMSAYGKIKLVQITGDTGGVRDVMPHLGYCTKREMVSGLRAFLAGKWQVDDEQRRGIKAMRAERASEYAIRYWQENEHKTRKATSRGEFDALKREAAPLRATESALIQEGGISTPLTSGGI